MQIRDKSAMSDDLCELDDDVLCLSPEASGDHQASHRYEGVATPASHVTSCEMRETRRHSVTMPLELGRWYAAELLKCSKCQPLHKSLIRAQVDKPVSHPYLCDLVYGCVVQLFQHTRSILRLECGGQRLDVLDALAKVVSDRIELIRSELGVPQSVPRVF